MREDELLRARRQQQQQEEALQLREKELFQREYQLFERELQISLQQITSPHKPQVTPRLISALNFEILKNCIYRYLSGENLCNENLIKYI